MIMSGPHSHMIDAMKGGKTLEAKGKIERKKLEKNESMTRTRALLEITEMTENLEMAEIGEKLGILETDGN